MDCGNLKDQNAFNQKECERNMIQIKRDNSGDAMRAFVEFREKNGRITKLWIAQGIDLVVEQKFKGKKAFMSHYSDPGTAFYSRLLWFLYAHHLPIPKIPTYSHTPPNEILDAGEYEARMTEHFSNGINYRPGTDGKLVAKANPKYEYGKLPELDIEYNEKKFTFSTQLIQAMVKEIPKLNYHTGNLFSHMNSIVLKLSKEGKIRPITVSWITKKRTRKPKQLEFEFMKELKKKRTQHSIRNRRR